jgi:hypothetical protein
MNDLILTDKLLADRLADSVKLSRKSTLELKNLLDKDGVIAKNYSATIEAKNEANSAAIAMLGVMNSDSKSRDQKYITTVNKVNDLNIKASEFAKHVRESLDRLKMERIFKDWRRILVDELPRTPLGNVFDKFSKEIKNKIELATNISVGEVEVISFIENNLDKVQSNLAASLGGPSTINKSSKNAVAQLKKQPFRAADKNIKKITKESNEVYWNTQPVTGLDISGDGNAQYVIIQESPTHYRVKELSVDPSAVVQLNLDIGDMAVDLLKTAASAAASAYGIPLPGAGGKDSKGEELATSQPDTGNQADLAMQERLILDAMKKAISGLSARLRTQMQSLKDIDAGDKLNPYGVRQLQSLLQGYEVQLSTISNEAGKLSGGEPAESGTSDNGENTSSNETPTG